MRYLGIFVLCTIAAGTATAAAPKSFLSATAFPKTFADLDFKTRVDVLAAGYEPWESEYDPQTGRCISGCPYSQITLDDDIAQMTRQTAVSNQYLAQGGYVDAYREYNKNMRIAQNAIVSGATATCAPRQSAIPLTQTIPLGEPLSNRPKISSPYNPRRIHPVTGNISPHKGVDYAVSSGTAVFSPASGTVSSVWSDATCGNGIKIQHSGGYETVYCHLASQQVRENDVVAAGCLVGYSGNTGRSTGPHLHYAIKQNGTYIDPTAMLGRD